MKFHVQWSWLLKQFDQAMSLFPSATVTEHLESVFVSTSNSGWRTGAAIGLVLKHRKTNLQCSLAYCTWPINVFWCCVAYKDLRKIQWWSGRPSAGTNTSEIVAWNLHTRNDQGQHCLVTNLLSHSLIYHTLFSCCIGNIRSVHLCKLFERHFQFVHEVNHIWGGEFNPTTQADNH